MIAETKEDLLSWNKSGKDLNLSFGSDENLLLKHVMAKFYAKMRFTAEVMRQPNGSRYDTYDCVQESDASLRRFLLDSKGAVTCTGATRLRNSSAEEIDLMEKYKNSLPSKLPVWVVF